MANCDKCASKIIDSKCKCGYWYEADEAPDFSKLIERTVLAYDHMTKFLNSSEPLSADHDSGNCVIFFKGDYNFCVKVKEFITKEAQENQTEEII